MPNTWYLGRCSAEVRRRPRAGASATLDTARRPGRTSGGPRRKGARWWTRRRATSSPCPRASPVISPVISQATGQRRRPTWPGCSAVAPGGTRPPSPSCTTPRHTASTVSPLRVVRDPAQAQEVTQEAYLDVWRTASRFDPAKGSAISWLMTIVHRKAVDRVRSAEAASRRDTAYHEVDRVVEHDVTADAAEASFEARRVRTALAGLTVVQREALDPRLLRRLHPHRGGEHARPPGGHGQDPHPRRTDPVARRTGSGR